MYDIKMIGKKTAVKMAVGLSIAMLSLTACGKGSQGAQAGSTQQEEAVSAETQVSADGKEGAGENTQKLFGIYKLKEIQGGNGAGAEDVALLEGYGMMFYINFKEDGTFTANFYGEESDGTYGDDTIVLRNVELPYTAKDDVITIEEGDEKIILVQTTQEEIDKILANVDEIPGAEATAAAPEQEQEPEQEPEE